MKRKAPDTEMDLALLVDRTLADVPLAAEEVREAARETGVNIKRLASRLRARVEAAHADAQRAQFVAAEQKLAAARADLERRLGPPKRLTSEQARSRLREMRGRIGAPMEAHFHKLDQLSEDDLNRLVEEYELLFDKEQG
ncbi:hypothetical protein [Polyangium mundeleinium]|uniref:Uncharacterized protein n=1 Tax=Polyangium mundeleinium TaxID=2995306 RepID=A0ABT5EHW3_9BACT|nr:hypothetical protein [Polyangium mundeleinium]MDC0740962.1 hypothetical protein [Polyangium mundeleinium]